MSILTGSERKVILFFVVSLLLGSVLFTFRDSLLAKEPPSYKVNINQADETVLISIPGIGPALARRIIDYRNTHGPFSGIDDLKKVKGIGPQKFEKMKEFIIANENKL